MAEKLNARYVKATVGRVSVGEVGKNKTPAYIVEVSSPEWTGDVTCYLTPGAIPYTLEKMKACGLPEGKFLTWLQDNPNGLAGNTITVFLFDEEYDGKIIAKSDIVTRPKIEKMTPEKLAALDGLLAAASGKPAEDPDGLPF